MDLYPNPMEKFLELESRSKKLDELVVSEDFTVDEVIAENNLQLINVFSDDYWAGEVQRTYEGGYTSKLILKVSPKNQDVPIKTLNFNGASSVKAGDYISAQIPRYKENKDFIHFVFSHDIILYLEREFDHEESAIELTLFSEDGKVSRRERSVDYHKFLAEQVLRPLEKQNL